MLSACDSGLSEVRPGDELIGLVAALHDWLGRGLAPAEALAAAGSGSDAGGDALVASAWFVCFGAG